MKFRKTLGDFPCEEIGFVTDGNVEVDGQNWGNIHFWKEKYENAIGNLLGDNRSGKRFRININFIH